MQFEMIIFYLYVANFKYLIMCLGMQFKEDLCMEHNMVLNLKIKLTFTYQNWEALFLDGGGLC